MRALPLVLASSLLVVPRAARATEPDTSLAFFTAAALDAAGFIVGGAIVSTSPAGGSGDERRSFGWLAMQAGYTVSPLVAQGMVGQWSRGAVFAAIPAGTLAGTAAFYRLKTDGVESNSLEQQRLVWGLFTVGLAVSMAGAIDVLLAGNPPRERMVAVRPNIGPGQAGLQIEGTL